MWFATLLIVLALLYVIFPWDLDFLPVVGRIDDVIVVLLAFYYYWKKKKIIDSMAGGGTRREGAAGGSARRSRSDEEEGEGDPYRLLGVDPGDDEQTIKKAYRELLGKYHPDRVQHLGEEFREMAARRTRAITRAWQSIREARDFS